MVLLRKVARHQERKLKCLLLIESGVAETGIVGGQVIFVQTFTAPETLRHSLSSEFEMHASKVAPLLLVYEKCLLQFAVDVVESACLDARWGGERVAVHGVALPDHSLSEFRIFDSADMQGQQTGHLPGAIASDQRDLARLACWIERPEEVQKIFCRRRGSHLDTNWVRNPAKELDMSMVKLSCSVSNPEEVSRCVKMLLGCGRTDVGS